MPALTPAEQTLFDDYFAQWDPVKVLRSHYPGTYRLARQAGMDDDDIRQSSAFGVMRAAQKWDPTRARFHTYANIWARSRVGHAARRLHQGRLGRLVDADRPSRRSQGGRKPVDLWTALGVTDPTRPEDDPVEFDRLDALRARVLEAVKTLPGRYRTVIELRYGLTGGEPMSLLAIGLVFGVTRERIRQMEAKSLAKVAVWLQVRCFDLLRLGRHKYSLHGQSTVDVPVPVKAPPTLCPACGRPYTNPDYRRCYACHPTRRRPPAALGITGEAA